MDTREFQIGSLSIGGRQPLVLIAGLCVIESLAHTMMIASRLQEITQQLQLPFIFKVSYDKVNRTSLKSYRGPGIEDALQIMAQVKEKLDVPILTDVHSEQQVPAAEVICGLLPHPTRRPTRLAPLRHVCENKHRRGRALDQSELPLGTVSPLVFVVTLDSR